MGLKVLMFVDILTSRANEFRNNAPANRMELCINVVHNVVIIGMSSIIVVKNRISTKNIKKISWYLVTVDFKHKTSHFPCVIFNDFSGCE